MWAVLLRDYHTQYPDPVCFVRGDAIVAGARDTEWPEFIWATDPAGRSGWVHQSYLSADRGSVLGLRDYSARELDASAGERVRLIEQAGGWWWAENERGVQGWLPARDLSMELERGDA
ncbi:MAG: SH3 domain-containing protein [Rhodanobacteraceae bacterium]|nr:SH3 domain-containing protein [Rhodanobacteraceae bacterium]